MSGQPNAIPLASGGLAVRLFVVMSSGYLMSYGLRAINATIAPELVQDLGLSNTELGSLTSAYFLAFALMQLPVGIWLDRFGPRRVDAALYCIMRPAISKWCRIIWPRPRLSTSPIITIINRGRQVEWPLIRLPQPSRLSWKSAKAASSA